MSPWIVTSRRKVHRRDSRCRERIAFPSSWLPSVARPADHACGLPSCLSGVLPDADDEADLTTPAPHPRTPEPSERSGGEGSR